MMEGIASILVFTVLVASVTMMLMISLRISTNATNDAMVRQLEAGAVLAGDAALLDTLDGIDLLHDDDGTVTFTIGTGAAAFTVSIDVDIYSTAASDSVDDNDVFNFIAFEP